MSARLQGCAISVPGAYQAVVKAFRIINPEARPTEAHSDEMADAKSTKGLKRSDHGEYLWKKELSGVCSMIGDDPRLI